MKTLTYILVIFLVIWTLIDLQKGSSHRHLKQDIEVLDQKINLLTLKIDSLNSRL